jgi:hypothetical protein
MLARPPRCTRLHRFDAFPYAITIRDGRARQIAIRTGRGSKRGAEFCAAFLASRFVFPAGPPRRRDVAEDLVLASP